jgi:hypothetical protein
MSKTPTFLRSRNRTANRQQINSKAWNRTRRTEDFSDKNTRHYWGFGNFWCFGQQLAGKCRLYFNLLGWSLVFLNGFFING